MKYSADAEHNEPLLFNFRPVQPLGNRTVSYSLQTIDADEHHEWGYEEGYGAATWAAKFPTCRGERQSPIDIDTEHVTYKEMGSPVLSGYYRVDLALSNNGHSAVASVPSSSALMFLDEEQYDLAQFHFHWGAANSRGSEHTVDGRSYPGELHLVHFKAAYGNLSEALKHADGLAVLGFFIEVGQKENAYLKPLSDRLAHVKLAGSEPVPIAGFKLQSLVEGRLDRFYRYAGSLTTPSCDEVVMWTVMKHPIVISQAQMNAFRQLSKSSRGNAAADPSPIGENYRPTQPLGSRTVYYNKPTVKQEEHTWTYAGKHGPASWSEVSEACVADRQSPINIDTRNLAYLDADAPTLTGYDKVTQVVLKNNGHTIQCDVSGNDQYIEGGDLPGERFLLAQFHFHWGASNLHGSEHRVNGQSYPMEIHFVHYNSKYGSPSDALGHEDGLAVLGVFFEIDESDNEDFNVLIDSLREVQFAGSERPLSGLRLAPLLGSTDVFYRYKGSLTTPPCSEVVTWTVFQAPVKISNRQVAAFREMYSSERGTSSNDPELIGENFREVNPLGERVVYVNDMKAATVLGGGATGLRASLSFYGLVILMLTHLLLRSS